jgi:hypothetical protein
LATAEFALAEMNAKERRYFLLGTLPSFGAEHFEAAKLPTLRNRSSPHVARIELKGND